MPIFLIPLLALAMMFVQHGQPAVRPPHTPEVVQEHGQEISQIIPPVDPVPASSTQDDSPELNHNNTFNPPTEKHEENNADDSPNLNPQNTWNPVETEKIEAVNDKSEKPMPTEIPQNAVDNSPALSPAPVSVPVSVEPVEPHPVPPPVKDWPHEEITDHPLSPSMAPVSKPGVEIF